MKTYLRPVSLALLAALSFVTARASEDTAAPTEPASIAAEQAAQHIGERATVCGVVEGTVYLSNSQNKLTFLNFGAAHPNQVFDVVIEDADRAKFSEPPEIHFKGKKVCVTGTIADFKGRPQIKVTDPGQISVEEPPPAP